MKPLLLAHRAPPDCEWVGWYRYGRTHLYLLADEARITADVMAGHLAGGAAGAHEDNEALFDALENE